MDVDRLVPWKRGTVEPRFVLARRARSEGAR